MAGLFYSAVGCRRGSLWGFYLARQVETRFEGRRWSMPARVYSDSTLLFPGQKINPSAFEQKLRRLGYREVDNNPTHPGEMRIGDRSFDIYLEDVATPFLTRNSHPVRIEYRKSKIRHITHLETQAQMPLLELEPEELTRLFGQERERRSLVSFEELPQNLINAVLAIEDHQFYQHHGISLRGILRALVINIHKGGIHQGGSTITQQLAKNYFLTPERTYRRKLTELFIALIIEFRYKKDEILEIYLNEIYWGQNGAEAINGAGEAARFYFGKKISALTLSEAAVLAGLIKAPNVYSPYLHPERCQQRRNTVLRAMVQMGMIDKADLIRESPLSVKTIGKHPAGRKAPYFLDTVNRQLSELYTPSTLTQLGLSIYTTLDTEVQAAAEKALSDGLQQLEKANPPLVRENPLQRLQGAVVVIQPKTGSILALVGGRDYGSSQFDRVTQAKRQAGSTIKPFLYLTALDRFSLITLLDNRPRDFIVNGRVWHPKNYDPAAKPVYTLRSALATSQNIATVNLALEVGLDRLSKTVQRFHLASSVEPVPAVALGAIDVTPLDLAVAYCAFAADGVRPFPLTIKDVTNETGEVIERHHANIEKMTTPEKAFLINSVLRSAVTGGTARSLPNRGVTWPVAGKTGTTNNTRDAWFVGYTPDILALIWVGFDDGTPIHASGSRAALPIWADLMKQIPQYISGNWFRVPPKIKRLTVCGESGQIAQKDYCPSQIEEFFIDEHMPNEECSLHQPRQGVGQILERIRKRVFNF